MAYLPPLPDVPGGLGTAESIYQSKYGTAPYDELRRKAQSRFSLMNLLAGGLSGLAAGPGLNFGYSLGRGFGLSYGRSQAASRAAQEYAMKAAEQQQAEEDKAYQRQKDEAYLRIAEKNATREPPKPEKLELWQRSPEDQAKAIAFEANRAKALAAAVPKPGEKPKSEKPSLADFDKFADDYRQEKDVSNFTTIRDYYKRMQSSSKLGTGPGDLSLIFSFMKVLDPTSVVRETEFSNAEQAVGRVQQFFNVPKGWVQGTRLTPVGRAGFMRAAKEIYDTQRRTLGATQERYRRAAKKYGVDPNDFITDYGDSTGDPLDQFMR